MSRALLCFQKSSNRWRPLQNLPNPTNFRHFESLGGASQKRSRLFPAYTSEVSAGSRSVRGSRAWKVSDRLMRVVVCLC
ncbi:hypothetical protein TNIN_127131 [Trichonephila inaurata madagascariensis]|uniref:Uncharacterized protein n=1 Tax=Trichonephila inaurata madagascariensis TaxID=2747483 RepID=A0A8X7CRB4_9ARAC|nr:hypothetical protein TNIN_127131 [Trichonephila inaurata madagascariensis]